MEHPAKVLRNNGEESVEFMCGGRIYIFKPGEQAAIDGFVAYHALNMVNTGLVEVNEESQLDKEAIPFKEMSWKDLVTLASGKPWYKVGINKMQIIENLENDQQTGGVQGSASKEETKGA